MGGPGSGVRKTTTLGLKKPKSRAVTVAGSFLQAFRVDLAKIAGEAWPCERWQRDPVGFVKEVLRVERVFPWQADILVALVDDRARVTVRSCHKAGKTALLVWAALWFYCSFPRASVNLSADNAKQIRRVDWKELKYTIWAARKEGFTIEDPAEDPSTGLVSPDGRAIYGFTTRNIEGWGGVSSPNLLFMIDEASSLDAATSEAIEGNTAGGARMLFISNPTRAEGPFFETFHKDKRFWRGFHLDGEAIAAWCDSNGVHIPGIADGKVLGEWKEKYGAESPFYQVRARGNFVLNEAGKCISLGLILEAQRRGQDVAPEGRLSLGVDPAGPGFGGDKWGFCCSRENAVLFLSAKPGLTEEAGIAEVEGLLRVHRGADETPRVIVDTEGPIGSAFYGRLRARSDALRDTRPGEFYEVFGVKASSKARRRPDVYARVRQEIWANAAEWLKQGAIPADYDLEQELHLPSWVPTVGGLLDMTAKDIFRERLERSPDKADAFILSVWNPTPWLDNEEGPPEPPAIEEGGRGAFARVPMGQMGAAVLGSPYELLGGAMGGWKPPRS